ncbi:MAG: allophanate hydrolase subunit 1 [Alphaproteobacteria bacterium]|nr:allophanate hydrolase subunit 1 [Alphaproteobacteria bacterium]
MIYAEPRFLPGGDRFIQVELGDEMSFDMNFRVHSLARMLREAKIKGLVELIPEMASMLLSYDPDIISFADLAKEVRRMQANMGDLDGLELESRLYYVPLLYFDPWTAACVEDYRTKVAPKPVLDPDLLCEANGLGSRDELKKVHSRTEYYVAALGFWPGLCSLMPLHPGSRLTAPKYNPPRMWTPKGTVGLGGALTCIYPDQTPGGYQIFARTPMPIWDRHQKLHAFKDSLALFHAGDRVRFIPIDRKEYDEIEAEVEAGTYIHNAVDYQKFSIRAYKAWLANLPPDTTGRAP